MTTQPKKWLELTVTQHAAAYLVAVIFGTLRSTIIKGGDRGQAEVAPRIRRTSDRFQFVYHTSN